MSKQPAEAKNKKEDKKGKTEESSISLFVEQLRAQLDEAISNSNAKESGIAFQCRGITLCMEVAAEFKTDTELGVGGSWFNFLPVTVGMKQEKTKGMTHTVTLDLLPLKFHLPGGGGDGMSDKEKEIGDVIYGALSNKNYNDVLLSIKENPNSKRHIVQLDIGKKQGPVGLFGSKKVFTPKKPGPEKIPVT